MPPADALAKLKIVPYPVAENGKEKLKRVRALLGVSDKSFDPAVAGIPFLNADVTMGVENELQTVVQGQPHTVDLPLSISSSSYFKNVEKRSHTGDAPLKVLQELAGYLDENETQIWENSWVSFPEEVLSDYAAGVFDMDIRVDKAGAGISRRSDFERFFHLRKGIPHIRIPVSYLLKLALSDAVCPENSHPDITRIGEKLAPHFLNDNTSPEIYSFYPVSGNSTESAGTGVARETLKRFLLTQLLAVYANLKFKLSENGQRTMVYFAPNTPIRQKLLNDMVPDAFYRELFMSPCLSGWDNGEAKSRYMGLCHQVLSRSQLNAVAKLKEAGIITSNLMVLPNTSNTSLTNNGTHISIGSRALGRLLKNKGSGFTDADEKYFGDLAIKIMEHFLPLFVGTYSAAPYRLDFDAFHPEKVLGFLPHELDYTHIRMIWRRWKKKARNHLLGRSLTPFGPVWLDRLISRMFKLRGDFLTDYRLLDYLVCLMSTDERPALDGRMGNDDRLKKDLAELGVFDTAMSMYLFCKLRPFAAMSFSGFENRLHSQFADLQTDLSAAAGLQQLISAYAYKMILAGRVTHEDIPDAPFVESERRQVIFGAAIGLPTFYVKMNTRNRFLAAIVAATANTRPSRRYHGYVRVQIKDYLSALTATLKRDASDLVDAMPLGDILDDLNERLLDPEALSAKGRLTRGILETAGAKSPLSIDSSQFNAAAEAYYRDGLRKTHMNAAFEILHDDLKALDAWTTWRQGRYNRPLLHILNGRQPQRFMMSIRQDVMNEQVGIEDLTRLIHLTILTIHRDMKAAEAAEKDKENI